MTRIGIIREGKTPPDKRFPLTPNQCKAIIEKYPGTEIFVQPSAIRAIPDSAYAVEGMHLRDDLSNCDILMGIKEVPVGMLIPDKTYMFFSHTFKKQPHNRHLLQTILKKRISLIDYELLVDSQGKRLIGFGKYAGIVGCYNGLLGLGKKFGLYELKPAHQCRDREEVEEELKKVSFPDRFKLVLTGGGRVGTGALEILDLLPIKKLSPDDFLSTKDSAPAYTQLEVQDYNRNRDGKAFDRQEFYQHPERFESDFMRFAKVADMYISCHYWDKRSPLIISKEEIQDREFSIRMVADISCDINGPIASTVRPSTIEFPFYGYDPLNHEETDFMSADAIGVMAVDNLPCELPMDASADFGDELLRNVMPELLSEGRSIVIEGARETTLHGELTQKFSYLRDYVQSV